MAKQIISNGQLYDAAGNLIVDLTESPGQVRLPTTASPSTAAGALSYSGANVLVGDGSVAQMLGRRVAASTVAVTSSSETTLLTYTPATAGLKILNTAYATTQSDANAVTATITVGPNPYGVGVNASTNTIYVANANSDTVSVIDGATNAVTATITVGSDPDGVGVNASTNTIYVPNAASNTVSVIDGGGGSFA